MASFIAASFAAADVTQRPHRSCDRHIPLEIAVLG
jgi:hypothetical protein